ncbi:unnamed protein product [Arabidopsis lyrata]|uniref:Predicted protein n=1 Tax=Arabidopsis lyrata subsp. lyrata TaxID=81972 RepID=D7KE32_ARALL|nr:predicted protein [Arabidopsis lyrata subsp. lyrata]CAH8255028.1 unnamed protein product [Arabidopsis lyrata]
MVLFSSRYIMRWKLEEIYEKAKKEIDSLERKCEEHIETTKKDRASLNQKLEVMETCKLISDADEILEILGRTSQATNVQDKST